MMKRLRQCCILLWLPLFTIAQEENRGIHFEQNLSWNQIKEKAKAANKNIFVDCYATWCGPCKQMDQNVFTTEKVGDYFNEKFISVRVQMDKTDNDDSMVKSWRPMNNYFQEVYTINAFPTFLFFSPDGKPLHKAVGAQSADIFLSVGKDAENPEKQYYSILRNYVPGAIDTSELSGLAASLKFTDTALASRMAMDYISQLPVSEMIKQKNVAFISQFKNDKSLKDLVLDSIRQFRPADLPRNGYRDLISIYKSDTSIKKLVVSFISSLSDKELLNRETLLLLADFPGMINTSNRYFRLYYKKGKEVERAIGTDMVKDYACQMARYIIGKEYIYPVMDRSYKDKEDIAWDSLFKLIQKKFTKEYAERLITESKFIFYINKTRQAEKSNSEEKWKWGELAAKWLTIKFDKYGFDTSGSFAGALQGNAIEYSIYRYANDPQIIQKGIDWIDHIIRFTPGRAFNYVYAGLLYKAGKTEAAKAWQRMNLQLIENDCLHQKKDPVKDAEYLKQRDILRKMEEGQPFKNLIYWP